MNQTICCRPFSKVLIIAAVVSVVKAPPASGAKTAMGWAMLALVMTAGKCHRPWVLTVAPL